MWLNGFQIQKDFLCLSRDYCILILQAGATLAFHPAALQLLASKLSAVNGDARRALDLARRAVEKESEKQFNAKMNAANVLNPSEEVMAVPLTSGLCFRIPLNSLKYAQ